MGLAGIFLPQIPHPIGRLGPGLWNSFLSHLKDDDISYSEFRQSLKTFLFGQWGHGAE